MAQIASQAVFHKAAQASPQVNRKSSGKENLLDQNNLTPGETVNAIRSRLYYLLSLAFSFPGEELQSARSELWGLAITLYPDMGINREGLNISLDDMASEYINVFDGHDQKKYCKPYEGQWHEADRARRQWEIKKFYRFFGLGLNKANNEMPDHIMCELEFMHFLSYRMVATGAGGLTDREANRPQHFLQAQKDFLERHLHSWVDGFCKQLLDKTDILFYHQLARITARFIKDDLEWLQDQARVADGKEQGILTGRQD